MITHLISTTEFVKLVNSIETKQCYCAEEFDTKIAENYGKIIRYANFISQKPILDMFVPVDEEGNVLEEPKLPYNKPTWCDKCEELNPEYSKWYKAQSKVLFKGWKRDIIDDDEVLCYKNSMYFVLENYNTLEEISLSYDLELTKEILEQIGL